MKQRNTSVDDCFMVNISEQETHDATLWHFSLDPLDNCIQSSTFSDYLSNEFKELLECAFFFRFFSGIVKQHGGKLPSTLD